MDKATKRKFPLPKPVYVGRKIKEKKLDEILQENHKNDVPGPAKLNLDVQEDEMELGLLIEDFKGVTEEVTIDIEDPVESEDEEIPGDET